MDIGDRIRERRKALGLTQLELAKRLGLTSKAAISTVENNKEDMTTERIRKYAEALDTTPQYLMGWISRPDRPAKREHPLVLDITPMIDSMTDAMVENVPYYEDETAEIAQEIFENEGLHILFDAARDSRPEDLQMAADLLKRLKATNPDG